MEMRDIISESIGAAAVMEALGITSGELTQRECKRIYGSWFTDAVRNGLLKPCRYGEGERPGKYYRVMDILTLKRRLLIQAELK